jgi:hypothetical protein
MMDIPEPSPSPSRWSPLVASWRGAKAGARIISYVGVPLGLLLLVLALIPTAIGLGAGRGVGLHPAAIRAVALPPAMALWGGMVGAVLGLFAWLLGRLAGARDGGAIVDRPIRLPWRPRSRVLAWWTWRRVAIWLGVVPLVAAFAGALVVGVVAGRFVDRRLAAAMAAADRDDPRWRLDDLMADREVVPDDENAALVAAEVLMLMPSDWLGAHSAFPGAPRSTPSAAGEAFRRLDEVESPVRLDDATARAIGEALGSFEDAVLLARTIAAYRRGQHAFELAPNLIGTPLPESQDARIVARLLTADAAIRAHGGDLDGALDSCRAVLGVGRSIGDEPFVISGLVRAAIGGVGLDSIRRVLARGEPPEEALARTQADVLDERARPLLLQAFRGERAIMDEIIRRIRDGEIPIESLGPADDRTRDGTAAGRAPAIAPWGRLLFDHQRAVGLEWANALVALAREPAPGRARLRRAWDAELERVKESRFGRFGAVLPLLMMPAMTAADTALTRYQANLGATAILLAAERHRRRTGAWPATIDAIDPAILADPPLDPFSGRPFRSERRDGQWLVHSVGPNGKDERGAFDRKTWNAGGPDDIGTRGWDVPLRGQAPTAVGEGPPDGPAAP